MPSYRTREVKPKRKQTKQRGTTKGFPRDARTLLRWAGRGSVKDYSRLAEAAKRMRNSLPAYIDGVAFEKLTHVDRLLMIEEIQASEQHDISAGGFIDGLSWLLDKVPGSGRCRPRSPPSRRKRATGSTRSTSSTRDSGGRPTGPSTADPT